MPRPSVGRPEMKPSEYTLERNANGSMTAWWTDSTGHLCHMTFYGYTRREIRAIMRDERQLAERRSRGRALRAL